MRVVHVVPAIAEEASGPSYSVPRLCDSIRGAGADVELATLDWSRARDRLPYQRTFPLGFGPRRLGTSPGLKRWLEEQSMTGDIAVIHSHGLWMMPNVYAGQACRTGRPQLVVSPRGTLSSWALRRSALLKKVFWIGWQAKALRSTACFHATAQAEYEDIRARGFTQPVCVLPNGIDVPPLHAAEKNGRKRLLFLGRIHPVKGLDVLLRAWQVVEDRFSDWDLHIAGPDDKGHLAEMRSLAGKLQVKRVFFHGPQYGEEKLRVYRAAWLFVLPSHSENFGVTVGEALAAGVPAIVTRGAPWSGLPEHGAGWWIEMGLEPLIACLEEALSTPPKRLAEMGRSGRDWMRREFAWDRIGAQFLETYHWLHSGGDTPPWVRLS